MKGRFVTFEAYCGNCGDGVTSLEYGPVSPAYLSPESLAGFCASCGNVLTLARRQRIKSKAGPDAPTPGETTHE